VAQIPTGPDDVVRAFTFAAEFVRWWHEAGRKFYGKSTRMEQAPDWMRRAADVPREARRYRATYQCSACRNSRHDEGLEMLALDACRVLGGWRVVRRMLSGREAVQSSASRMTSRGIRLRGEEE
jgi:hypothetical protein